MSVTDQNILSDPRAHHYTFAHIALREVCDQNPIRFFAILGSPEQQNFVRMIWEMVEVNCKAEEMPDYDSSDVQVETFMIDDYPAVLFTMPEARAMAEAHMVLVVLKVRYSDLAEMEQEEKVDYGYFTLEKGLNLDGTPRTVLCEWRGDDHANFGDGPAIDPELFVKSIAERLHQAMTTESG